MSKFTDMFKKVAQDPYPVEETARTGMGAGAGLGGLGGGLLGAYYGGMKGQEHAKEQGGLFGPSDEDQLRDILLGAGLGGLAGAGLGAGAGAIGGAGVGSTGAMLGNYLEEQGYGPGGGTQAPMPPARSQAYGSPPSYSGTMGEFGGGMKYSASKCNPHCCDDSCPPHCDQITAPTKDQPSKGGALGVPKSDEHNPVSQYPVETAATDPSEKKGSVDEFLWETLEIVLGPEKAAALKHTPLDVIVTHKIASEYDQPVVGSLEWAHVVRHLGEKIGEANRRWRSVHAGLDSIAYLAEKGVYEAPETKTASYKKLMKDPLVRGAATALGAGAVATPLAIGTGRHLIGNAREEAQKAALPIGLASAGGSLLGSVGGGLAQRLGE